MLVGVLGVAEVHVDGHRVDLGTRKQRALLAALALHRGRPVAVDTLADLLWGDAPPPSVSATLQGYVARLRRALEPERPPRAPARVLVSEGPGYGLRLAPGTLDTQLLEAAVGRPPPSSGAPWDQTLSPEALEERLTELDAALGLWRGEPFGDLGDAPGVRAERARLEELRLVAQEVRAGTALSLGHHATVAADLEALTAAHPLRERAWALRAVALVRCGRQAEALDVLADVRGLLRDELGLEPGPELRALQGAVLRQEPGLRWREPVEPAQQAPPAVKPPRRSARPALAPLVGRDRERDALISLLDAAADGPAFAVVTGEPGIGKSRLCHELVDVADGAGVTVAVGLCTEDEGAPPLHPLATVLRSLRRELPATAAGGAFEAWDETARALLDAAGTEPLVVLVEDLHWADPSTLRVLRLVAETAHNQRLLLVTTWRDLPAPTGLLAAVATALARRHAHRVALTGLSAADGAHLVSAVSGAPVGDHTATAVRERTDGNPFFLVEYARLARERGDLSALLAEERPPAGVQDVLTRRLTTLPDETATLLRHACVVGRSFELGTLLALTPGDAAGEDELLRRLEPAIAAGLVLEEGVDRFAFAHALVRDTLEASMPRSRRARLHARLAAALHDAPGHRGEVARHWLRAGGRHAAEAWRAAWVAAREAEEVRAFTEAAGLLTQAVESQAQDAGVTREERCDLLIALAGTLQRADDWVGTRRRVHDALAVAQELGDLDRTVRAATLPLEGALWQSVEVGRVDVAMVAALRSALDRVGPGDSPSRCRVLLALAAETYYGSTPRDREALVGESLGIARRLDHPQLLLWALVSAMTTVWRAGTAEHRLGLGVEAAALATTLGDPVARSSATTLQAVAAGELGRVEEMETLVDTARRLADEARHPYAHLVLDALVAPWLAMRGDEERLEEVIGHAAGLAEATTLPQAADTVHGVSLGRALWVRERSELLEDVVDAVVASSILPVLTLSAALWARAGREDKARALLDTDPQRVREELDADIWFSPVVWASAAEAGLRLGRPELAAEAYGRLLPLAGRPAAGGSGVVLGPVDAFLGMAAAATGDPALAERHLRDAADRCREWGTGTAGAWVEEVRAEVIPA